MHRRPLISCTACRHRSRMPLEPKGCLLRRAPDQVLSAGARGTCTPALRAPAPPTLRGYATRKRHRPARGGPMGDCITGHGHRHPCLYRDESLTKTTGSGQRLCPLFPCPLIRKFRLLPLVVSMLACSHAALLPCCYEPDCRPLVHSSYPRTGSLHRAPPRATHLEGGPPPGGREHHSVQTSRHHEGPHQGACSR